MKTKLIPFLLFITLSCANCLAQSKSCDTIYDSKEIKAHYKKGELELNKFVIKQLLPIIGQCKENSSISSLFMYLTIDSKGKIIDVAVDLRKKSKTFGKHFKIILSDKNCTSIFIPPGFAHGFLTLKKENIVCYGCTEYRSPKNERPLYYNDPKLKIKWPTKNPIVSEKDKNANNFEYYLNNSFN